MLAALLFHPPARRGLLERRRLRADYALATARHTALYTNTYCLPAVAVQLTSLLLQTLRPMSDEGRNESEDEGGPRPAGVRPRERQREGERRVIVFPAFSPFSPSLPFLLLSRVTC